MIKSLKYLAACLPVLVVIEAMVIYSIQPAKMVGLDRLLEVLIAAFILICYVISSIIQATHIEQQSEESKELSATTKTAAEAADKSAKITEQKFKEDQVKESVAQLSTCQGALWQAERAFRYFDEIHRMKEITQLASGTPPRPDVSGIQINFIRDLPFINADLSVFISRAVAVVESGVADDTAWGLGNLFKSITEKVKERMSILSAQLPAAPPQPMPGGAGGGAGAPNVPTVN